MQFLTDHWCDRLYRFRQLQYWFSSFNTCVLINRMLLISSTALFLTGTSFVVIGRFFFWERYHLYGCRKDYDVNFPPVCSSDRRPSGVDLPTASCYSLAFVCLVLMFLLPLLVERVHWKRDLAEEIWFFCTRGMKQLKLDPTSLGWTLLPSLVCHLEGISPRNLDKSAKWIHQKTTQSSVTKKRFLTHLGSCVWTELFLLHIFAKKKMFAFLCISCILCFALPFVLPIVEHGLITGLCLTIATLVFALSPVLFGVLFFVTVIAVLASSGQGVWLPAVICLSVWGALWLAVLGGSYVSENRDEAELIKRAYNARLPMYVSTESGDLDLLLFLRGFRGHTVNTDISDFVKRVRTVDK